MISPKYLSTFNEKRRRSKLELCKREQGTTNITDWDSVIEKKLGDAGEELGPQLRNCPCR